MRVYTVSIDRLCIPHVPHLFRGSEPNIQASSTEIVFFVFETRFSPSHVGRFSHCVGLQSVIPDILLIDLSTTGTSGGVGVAAGAGPSAGPGSGGMNVMGVGAGGVDGAGSKPKKITLMKRDGKKGQSGAANGKNNSASKKSHAKVGWWW